MKRALTIGSFDPVHVDHVVLFRRCEELADEVVVAVNSDRFYTEYRGYPPTFKESERMQMVRVLGYTVVLNDGPGREVIQRVKPDLLVIGSDWLGKDYLSQIDCTRDFLERLGVSLLYVPRGRTISSTELKARCAR